MFFQDIVNQFFSLTYFDTRLYLNIFKEKKTMVVDLLIYSWLTVLLDGLLSYWIADLLTYWLTDWLTYLSADLLTYLLVDLLS